jgi:cell division protein FtsW (lipid II flippase)
MLTFYRFKNKLLLLILTSFAAVTSFAQDKKLDIDINVNKDKEQWYAQPWVWVVGGAVFILLLVAILKSGKKA